VDENSHLHTLAPLLTTNEPKQPTVMGPKSDLNVVKRGKISSLSPMLNPGDSTLNKLVT